MSETKIVYVVMGNDFPDAVFATEAVAEEYIAKKKVEPVHAGWRGPRIYWRVYAFSLRTDAST